MIRTLFTGAALALALTSSAALAAGEAIEIPDVAFAHEGPFGRFDTMQLQRGLQVYTEVCSACHGLKYVPIRTLSDEGGPEMPEDQIRAYAAAFPVNDPASNPQLIDPETGEPRALVPTDHFPAHNGFEPKAPDLSLMTKARVGFSGPYGLGINQFFKGIGGQEYVHALMLGYVDAPECATGDEPGYFNKYFAKGFVPESCKDHGHSEIVGSWIAMPPPLSDDQVTYADGTAATVDQMAMDVTAFLVWAAEPKLVARREAGFQAVAFLLILAALLYLTNKRLWAGVKGKHV
jgi:ubiquinol-cytochrome c reductase cytochrome c1 subunit